MPIDVSFIFFIIYRCERKNKDLCRKSSCYSARIVVQLQRFRDALFLVAWLSEQKLYVLILLSHFNSCFRVLLSRILFTLNMNPIIHLFLYTKTLLMFG